jgi:hypothetical protein
MDREGYVHRRKRRYLAVTLEDFEEKIEKQLPRDVRERLQANIDEFKGTVRGKLNALAVDACEVFGLDDEELNKAAEELRDSTDPRPHVGATHTP